MKKIFIIAFIAIIVAVAAFYMGCGSIDSSDSVKLPEPTEYLVNDYAEILSEEESQTLENKLRHYDNSRNVQILVLTINDLGGYEIADYAQRIGQYWGVGSKENNGVVMIIKPKNKTKGEAFIATGYSLEGCLPDITCRHIVSENMIPHFKEDDYYGGIKAAIRALSSTIDNELDY